VEFKSPVAAERVISQLNKSVLCQRVITIRRDVASQKERKMKDSEIILDMPKVGVAGTDRLRSSSSGSNSSSISVDRENTSAAVRRSRSVFVGHLAPGVDSETLRRHFER
jgi:RNA recognition motif-containing protein